MKLFAFRQPISRNAERALGLAGFMIFIYLWDVISSSALMRPEFLPAPLEVLKALVRLFTERDFASDVLVSIGRVWFAFALSVVIAVPLALLMSTYRAAGALFEPFIDFIRYLPVPALVPLLIIWFGIGESSKIAVLWVGTFFQLVLLITNDTNRVPAEYVESGFTLGASRMQVMRDIIIPAALPNIVDNIRITLGWCWTYLIVAEIVAAKSGIGYVIWSLRRFVKTPEVMAGIITIGIIGLVTDQSIRLLHRRYFLYLRRNDG
jgi:NitT/TauT family transport system permease protein